MRQSRGAAQLEGELQRFGCPPGQPEDEPEISSVATFRWSSQNILFAVRAMQRPCAASASRSSLPISRSASFRSEEAMVARSNSASKVSPPGFVLRASERRRPRSARRRSAIVRRAPASGSRPRRSRSSRGSPVSSRYRIALNASRRRSAWLDPPKRNLMFEDPMSNRVVRSTAVCSGGGTWSSDSMRRKKSPDVPCSRGPPGGPASDRSGHASACAPTMTPDRRRGTSSAGASRNSRRDQDAMSFAPRVVRRLIAFSALAESSFASFSRPRSDRIPARRTSQYGSPSITQALTWASSSANWRLARSRRQRSYVSR